MSHRSPLGRWVSGLAVAAMFLRAAVPMLAVGAAQLRGVAVGSVCMVYGVVLPEPFDGAHAGHPHSNSEHAGHDGQAPGSDEAHTGDHCALTVLVELAAPYAPMIDAVDGGRCPVVGLALSLQPVWGDASASWVARRKQGPPPVA